MVCSQISRPWQALAHDQFLWKPHCEAEGWEWREPPRIPEFEHSIPSESSDGSDDDEGMGDSDPEDPPSLPNPVLPPVPTCTPLRSFPTEADGDGHHGSTSSGSSNRAYGYSAAEYPRNAPLKPALVRRPLSSGSFTQRGEEPLIPDYRLLYRTHVLLQHRFRSRSFRLSALQMRNTPNTHAGAIYCLQLYTHPSGIQSLFTGSRDRTIREWNLSTGMVQRVISDVHQLSILSLCVGQGYLASAGTDNCHALFDLENNCLVKKLHHHTDSVLCIRFNDKRLVSCSKGKCSFTPVRLSLTSDSRPYYPNLQLPGLARAICIDCTSRSC